MKLTFRHILLPILVIAFTSSLYAQGIKSIGLQTGMNISYVTLSNEDYTISLATGLIVGVQSEMQLSGSISLEPQLLYARRGLKYQWDMPNISPLPEILDYSRELDYVQIPIMVIFKPGGKYVKPFVFVGPDMGIKIGDHTNATSNGQPVPPGWLIPEIETFDFALDGGAGLEIPLNHQLAIVGSVRYSFGLTTLFKETDNSWKSRCVQVLAGVNYAIL